VFYGIRDLPQPEREATPKPENKEQIKNQEIVNKIAAKAIEEMSQEKV